MNLSFKEDGIELFFAKLTDFIKSGKDNKDKFELTFNNEDKHPKVIFKPLNYDNPFKRHSDYLGYAKPEYYIETENNDFIYDIDEVIQIEKIF